jgi:hypothetical protein
LKTSICVSEVCSLEVTPALPLGSYTWQVRGTSPFYGTGAWNLLSFTIIP